MRNTRNSNHEDTIIQFLNGSNDYFKIVKSQILLMDPLPSMKKILFYDNSTWKKRQPKFVEETKVFVETTKRKNFGKCKGNNRETCLKKCLFSCSHCGNNRHNVDVCYKKNMYHLNFGSKNNYTMHNIIQEKSKENKDQSIKVNSSNS